MRKVSFVLVGLTNSGKSSLINELAGQTITVVGQGNGLSTTRRS